MARSVKTFSRILLLTLVPLLIGCKGSTQFLSLQTNSNGELLDHGKQFLWGRYFVNLGNIDLNQTKEYQFEISDLPPKRQFVLGLNMESGDCMIQESDMRISFFMTEEHGVSVINEDRALRELVWSKGRDNCIPAFGYIRGEGKEFPINNQGDVCIQPIFTGTDSGYGTYFVSRQNAVYYITVKLYREWPIQLGHHSAKIVMEDNGPESSISCIEHTTYEAQ